MTQLRRVDKLIRRATEMLEQWSIYARMQCVDHGSGKVSFGSGFRGWGAQANHYFIGSAMTLADQLPGSSDAAQLGELAHAALRYELSTHRTGTRPRADGTRWGHTWISVLGTERMMQALLPRWARFDPTRGPRSSDWSPAKRTG